MSNPQQKKFTPLSLEVPSYARINKEYRPDVKYPEGVDISALLKDVDTEMGLVMVFPPGFHYQESEGDQGVGKTSLQAVLLEATGNIVPVNAINSIDGTKAFKFKTWGNDGNLYLIRGTKTDYVIERIETDPETGEPVLNAKGKQIKAEMKSPKTFIRQICGPAGVSPMWLREMKPADQITWLQGLFSLDQEVLKEEVRIKTEYDTTYKARTKAGNEYDRYKALTQGNSFYTDQPKHEKYFTETSFEKLEQEFEETKTKYAEYQKNENLLKTAKETNLPNYEKGVTDADNDIADINEQIRVLQEKLTQAHNTKNQKVIALNEYKQRIEKTEGWLTENLKLKEDYDNLNNKIVEATEFKASKQQWELFLENQKQMNHFEDEYQRLTTRLDALKKAKQEFTEMFSPKIDGFEVCIPTEEDKREGLYYKGMPLTHLSESELWEMATQLWESLKVNMVFVEHISELGSGAVEFFNRFIARGGYVFGTKMNRAEKNLKITFSTNIK